MEAKDLQYLQSILSNLTLKEEMAESVRSFLANMELPENARDNAFVFFKNMIHRLICELGGVSENDDKEVRDAMFDVVNDYRFLKYNANDHGTKFCVHYYTIDQSVTASFDDRERTQNGMQVRYEEEKVTFMMDANKEDAVCALNAAIVETMTNIFKFLEGRSLCCSTPGTPTDDEFLDSPSEVRTYTKDL